MDIKEVEEYVKNKLEPILNEGVIKKKTYSYFQMDVFKRDNYFREFEDYYLKTRKYKKIKEDILLNELLGYVLLEEDVSLIINDMTLKLGDIKGIYTLSRRALDRIEKNHVTMFFFLDDIIFVEFNDFCLCFMIGNNE